MAFMTAPTSTGGGDRLPILKFDARAGRLFTIDRTQAPDGSWLTQQNDITMAQPPFCVDFGTLEVGWAHFAAGGPPQWALAFYGQPQPARPASPGHDDQNRVLQFKSAFRVKVAGQGIGGVREFGGNSGALITGMNDLHTRFEAAPEAATGKIPVVRMSSTTAIKSGQSTNYMPVFEIVAWVDRPTVLGERMVPVPGRALSTAPTPASVPVPPPAPRPVVPPQPVPQPPVQTAPQQPVATAYAPPVPPAGATALVDDDLPF
jgi:hypothetical protein